MARVAVLGAGAVGTLVGGLLAAREHAVTLIGRPKHVEAIARLGVRIEGLRQVVARVTATTDLAAAAAAEVVLLTVKSQDTEVAIQGAARHIARDATVVSLQNGVRNPETIARVVGASRTVAGVVLLGATYLSPGVVQFDMNGRILLGALDSTGAARASSAAALLADAVPTTTTNAIQGALWAKLVINLDLPVFALTGLAFPDGLRQPALRRVIMLAVNEGLVEVAAAGIDVDGTAAGQALRTKLALLQTSDADLDAHIKGARPFLPSALQSRLRGRPTEVAYINGEIVRLADARGRTAPVNARLCALTGRLHGRPEFLTPEELERDVLSDQ